MTLVGVFQLRMFCVSLTAVHCLQRLCWMLCLGSSPSYWLIMFIVTSDLLGEVWMEFSESYSMNVLSTLFLINLI